MTPTAAVRSRRRLQRGQATTEFALLGVVLVPLLLIVPLIGKYIDLIQTTEQASRYAAFEGTVRNTSSRWKSDADLATEVRRRFFSNPDAPVKTGDVAGNFAAHRNPIWSDARGQPLIDTFESGVDVRTGVSGTNVLATAVFADPLGLAGDNLYAASVTARPASVTGLPPFDRIALRASRTTVVIADAWTARNRASIRGKVEGVTAMYPMGRIQGLVGAAGQLPALIFDPALRAGDFDWDVVPCDRLIGGC
ncbi:MAG TPA: hypothetical protein VGP22_07280 [Albitalea sp.]|jgi:hypothetical protein|nr:hypothetical protein [Albitalea sp.]